MRTGDEPLARGYGDGADAGAGESAGGWVSRGIPMAEKAAIHLVVDGKKCIGCIACMLACSMVHEGRVSPSLARIQVIQDTWARFPADIDIATCRQCPDAKCIEACPTSALHFDAVHGHAITFDESLCNGCQACIDACQYRPSRIAWNHERNVAARCDLCVSAVFWKGGGVGKQACVEVCPMKAINTTSVPRGEEAAFQVNLRNEHWAWIGYPTD